MDGGAKAGRGGSALKRLKSDLKSAGVLGPQAKKRRTEPAELRGKPQRGENPFELKFTRAKHDVLGKSRAAVAGRPGATKIKAEERRRKTLLPELRKGKHESSFVDRRFGENNPNLSLEEKMMERFVKEKQKSLRKGASLFNIDDDEDQDDEFGGLTHLGRSLDLEGAMQGAVGSGSEDEDDMDGDTIGATNFGGFDEGDRANKSRSEIMKEVIAKSKYYKLERQKLKDENEDLRRELDAEVDDVRSLLLAMNEPAKAAPLPGKSTAPSATSAPIVNAADYDSLVHQLAGEKRAKPQDRLKSEEELAVERKEKLERLEQDRQRRLLGLLPEDEAMGRARHRPETSGDYLEPAAAFEAMDDFDAGEAPQALTYRDGKLVSGDIFVKKARPGRDLATVRKSAGEEDGEGSEGEDSEEEGSDEEGSDEDDASGSDEGSGEEDSDGEEGSGDESDNSMEDDGAEDSDLEHEEGDIAAASDEEELEEAPEMEEERQRKEELREERRLAAMKELPYVFPAPETHEEFEGFVAGRPASDLDTVIGRLRSLYHIKLHADNRQKMDTLFGILMDHLAMAYGTTPADVEAGEVVVKHLRELAQERAEIAYSHAHGYLEELNLRIENALAKGSTKTVLGPSDIALLQLLGQLFPTSDLRHPITTPLQMIICRFLDLRLLRNTRDMTVGLALCNMVVDFQKLSKRFMPEVAGYLEDLLLAIVQRRGSAAVEFEGPVKLSAGTKTSPVVLAVPAAQVIARLAQLYAELPALPELFAPHSAAIEALAKHAKNQAKTKLRDALASLRAVFDAILAERQPLKLQQHKPVPIASYLPKFEENFSATRRNDPNRDRAQAKKFQAQYKKEFKGAMREVRKDTMFVHRQRLQDIKEKDVAYRKKIQKIVGRIGLEAGQLKQAEKMAKKGKD